MNNGTYHRSPGYLTSHTVLVDWARNHDTVLDVGCASGFLFPDLMRNGSKVVGVEPDERAAVRASRWGAEVVNSTIEEAFSRFALDDRQFDCIIFGDVLEHLSDPWSVLRDVGDRLLRPSGSVLVSLPNVVSLRARLRIARGRWYYEKDGIFDETHLRFFDLIGGRDLVRRSGFAVVDEAYVGPLTYRFGRHGARATRRWAGLLANQMLFHCVLE